MRSLSAAQLTFSTRKLIIVVSCEEMRVISLILERSSLIFLAAESSIEAWLMKPSRPVFVMAAQLPAMAYPERVPAKVGVTYKPPDQSETGEKVNLLSSFVLNISTEQPLGPLQYLWGSQDIEVTPGTLKSNS